jgi:surface protein
VVAMPCMFENAYSFNQNLSSWDVASVENTTRIFGNATSFNQNLCPWGLVMETAQVDVADMCLGSGYDEVTDPDSESWCQACESILI